MCFGQRVNGHAAGDQILINIAARLKDNLRDMDTIARLGGDEFTIIMSTFREHRAINEVSLKLIDILKRPLLTEKTTIQKETANQLSFEVDRRANRVEIRRAIEQVFNVKVATVRTLQIKGKVKRRGRTVGKRRDWKKAVVTLMPGERIDFFEGV